MIIANELFKMAFDAGILGEGNKIAIDDLLAKVEENGYDWKQYGIDDFRDFLEEQDELTFETADDGTSYVVNAAFVLPRQNQAKTAQAICDVIAQMPRDGYGFVTTSALKAELERRDIKWGAMTLGAYVKKMTDYFDTVQEGVIVRVRVKSDKPMPVIPEAPTSLPQGGSAGSRQPAPTPSPDKKKRFVSMYELSDFACFADYDKSLRTLGTMAQEDGWFVIEDPNEPNPLRLVGQRLNNNFALSIRQEMREHGSGGIVIYPDGAVWNTGFRTPAGLAILAHFKLNQYRDATSWQAWIFDRFSVEEGGQA